MHACWSFTFVALFLCAQLPSSLSSSSLRDTEIKIERTPGNFILTNRSTTAVVDLPVLPGHTWSTDYSNIIAGDYPYFKRWIKDDQVVREGTAFSMTVSASDIGSTYKFYFNQYSTKDIYGPSVHLVLAPAPSIKTELPGSVHVFPGEYVDLTVETNFDDGLTTFTWDIEKAPLVLQTTNNVRFRANELLDGAKLTVSVRNAAGVATSSTIIKVLPPRWVIAISVIGGFILLCGFAIGILAGLHCLGYINLRRHIQRNNVHNKDYTLVGKTVTEEEEEDLTLTTETN